MFGSVAEMQRRHTGSLIQAISDPQRRADLIGNPNLPTCTVLCAAYGRPNVAVILEGHLASFGDAMGATYNAQQLQQIADDVLTAFHYLSFAEVILALKLGREGRFRDAQGRNVATTYGPLSSSVVMDILYRYCKDVRNPEIDRRERAQQKASVEEFAAFLRSKDLERRLKAKEEHGKEK